MDTKINVIDVTPAPPRRHDPSENKPLFASREKIYVREMKGTFQRIRHYSLWVLLVMYFGFAWINIDGQQIILFDLPERKFTLFGTVFWPQDFPLLAFALIICAFGLFFITTLFGRVWCGYSCPQTVWTFMFMWLEERIEGSRNQRIKLDQSPLTFDKLFKKILKHATWLALALATAVTFVGYFYPIRALASDLAMLTIDNGWALFWIGFFTIATYGNAGWLREQVCLYMCPYARFQSVMFTEDTLVIGYDQARGEPRGKPNPQLNSGDCVDCRLCVNVCPTGIDIRDGLQYECIGCALCIDACDSVMEKLDRDKGLIRYASEAEFAGKKSKHWKDARALGYGIALLLSIGGFGYLLDSRAQLEVDVIRDRNSLYQADAKGNIQNSYLLKIINKRQTPDKFSVDLRGLAGTIEWSGTVHADAGEIISVPITVTVPTRLIEDKTTTVFFDVSSESADGITASAESRFLYF